MTNRELYALVTWLQAEGEATFLEALLALYAMADKVRSQYATAKPGRSATMAIFNAAEESKERILLNVWQGYCADQAANRYMNSGLDPEAAAIAAALDPIPEKPYWVHAALTQAIRQSTLRTETATQGSLHRYSRNSYSGPYSLAPTPGGNRHTRTALHPRPEGIAGV